MTSTMQQKPLSLFEFALMLESYIDDAFGNQYFWVTAEIASINVRRGHCYLNLIEKDPGSTFPKAELKGIIWQNNFIRLNEKFSSVTGFPIKQDISILFLATVNYSPRYGLSLNIFDIRGEYTVGEMMAERQKTVEKLISSNLYDRNKQLPLPVVPQRIAALSAGDSKGFEDFLNVLKKNHHGYQFFVRLFPVMLQGNRAAESIAQQLKEIEKQKDNFDTVILVRGGGGNVDLHCFNSYTLAEAIAKCNLPVITGIGHTTDYTVADEVAALHKETPTAVAQYIVSVCIAFEDEINEKASKLGFVSVRMMDYEIMHLEKAAGTLKYRPQHAINNESIQISHNSEKISSKSLEIIRVAFSGIGQVLKELNRGLSFILKQESERLTSRDQILSASDPALLLKKGYSITRFKGKILKGIDKLKDEDEIETQVSNGTFTSKIQNIKRT